MANREHLKILKQGVDAWNKWRKENLGINPDLTEAKLYEAKLYEADLSEADLSGANLFEAKLTRANLYKAKLIRADLENAKALETNFIDIDLSVVEGLNKIIHRGPSSIGIDTIYKSRGKIPEVFLRNAGVPDILIEYMPSLTGQALEFYSCFISYSNKNDEFARRLHSRMREESLRVWFAPEDLKIGEKIRPGIDEAIRIYDKLLLILTEQSIDSEWVEDEVESAFEKEANQNKTVLFPIRLDNAVMETQKAWAAKIRRTRNIGDFRKWQTHGDFQKSFNRLLRDLKAEEKRGE